MATPAASSERISAAPTRRQTSDTERRCSRRPERTSFDSTGPRIGACRNGRIAYRPAPRRHRAHPGASRFLSGTRRQRSRVDQRAPGSTDRRRSHLMDGDLGHRWIVGELASGVASLARRSPFALRRRRASRRPNVCAGGACSLPSGRGVESRPRSAAWSRRLVTLPKARVREGL